MASLPKAMDAMERFNRRTISFSSRQDIMNEVAEILNNQSAAIEEDEESAASGDTFEEAAESDQGARWRFGAKIRMGSQFPSTSWSDRDTETV